MKTALFTEITDDLVVVSFYNKLGKRYLHNENYCRFESKSATETDVLYGNIGYAFSKGFEVIKTCQIHPKNLKDFKKEKQNV